MDGTFMGVNSSLDRELFQSYRKHINPAYPSFLEKLGLDRVAVRAEGATITDSEGKTYIDCVGGYGIFNLGHNHPEIIRALMDQLNAGQLFTRPFITEIPVRLAESLAEITPGELSCSFLCNSGSEAIDSAIKLARLHTGKKEIVTARNSFHGYTFGALSASGIPSFKKMFEPMVPGFVHVPFGDTEALRRAITPDTAAVLLEPVQHEAGVFVPPEDYFSRVRDVCTERGVLLILDEIKTGLGKTGRVFACEHFGIVPDMLILGKSLGGGLIPVGALTATKGLWRKFGLSFPMSATTYGGNLLACCVALTTLRVLRQEGLTESCVSKGEFLLEQLRRLGRAYPRILRSTNGLGLLIGLEAADPKKALELAKEVIRGGVLSLPAYGNPAVLMIEPPLVISVQQIQEVVSAFGAACEKLSRDK